MELLLAYYGDDFTGSTDVMEALTNGGVETVLFVQPPSPKLLARYQDVRAMGIAGSSRAMSPDEMEVELPAAFTSLLTHRPAFVHYKTCSTFDSSPNIGSIGKAIEIGRRELKNGVCPLVVGAPSLQRFCVFGNLFARSGLDSAPYRLDRHPTMKQHPVTPMDESDLRVHLKEQTDLPIRLIDVLALDDTSFDWGAAIGEHEGIVLFDTLRAEHLVSIGSIVTAMQLRAGKPMFVAGSSGVEYALVEAWKRAGLIGCDDEFSNAGAINKEAAARNETQTLIVSGSCSPVTARQIQWAVDNGFKELAFDTSVLGPVSASDRESTSVDSPSQRELDRVVIAATNQLRLGQSVIVHTCRGPADPRLAKTQVDAAQLGQALATVLHETLQRHPLKRVAVTGGDTSGHIARYIGIEALEMIGPLAPGAPLCVARSEDSAIKGIEITFKGGQVGHDDFFGSVLAGRPP